MEKEIFNRNKGLDYLHIAIEDNEERIVDDKDIVFYTNGYYGEMYLDIEELDLIIDRLSEFRDSLRKNIQPKLKCTTCGSSDIYL